MFPPPDPVVLRWRLRIALPALAGSAALLVALAAAARCAHLALFEDPGEDQAVVRIQLMGAAREIEGRGGKVYDTALVAAVLESAGDDPWGRGYRFERSPNHEHTYRMYTLGADDRRGGEGRDTDVVVWVDLEFGTRSTYGLDSPPFGLVW
jgi:hypothetical protein